MSDAGSTSAAALSAALEAALLRELRARYDWDNRTRFAGRLVPPVLVLSDATSHLGRWHSATRTLELTRALVLHRPWLEVASVLEHEMAHQFVDEVLRIRGETAHGDTFRRVCAERGIDHRAAGAPTAASPPAPRVPRPRHRPPRAPPRAPLHPPPRPPPSACSTGSASCSRSP